MKLSLESIKAICRVVTDMPYRSGHELVIFFNQFGWEDTYPFTASSRWKYALEKIQSLNDTDQMVALLEQSVDPRNFMGTDFNGEEIIANLNGYLQYDGYELIQEKLHYRIKRKRDEIAEGKPVKNLIFASTGSKPEIVLKDALNNDIEIVRNAEYCLVYDQPIPNEGLFWQTLVQWWADKNQLPYPHKDTSRNLFDRLNQSLADSPPERLLFSTYFRQFVPILKANLPALIPQVYLHYDPKTMKELGDERRLARQRMDFLMLLPNYQRIVIEVDGRQHYAIDNGTASPQKYAEMVSADRELRLAGYEIYRFGGFELQENKGEILVQRFFEKLFRRYMVTNE